MKGSLICGIMLFSVTFSFPTIKQKEAAGNYFSATQARTVVSEVRTAVSSGSLMSKPYVKNGHVRFNDVEDVILNVNGMSVRRAKLTKVNAGLNNLMFSSKANEQSAVYADFDNKVVCRKDCADDADCEQYCSIAFGDQGCFISGENAVCSNVDPVDMVDIVQGDNSPPPTNGFDSQNRSSDRHPRSLAPDMYTVGIVRVTFHVDDAFMIPFKVIAGNNATGGLAEATKYLKLVANEMTLSFQTLKDYGLTYTFAGEFHPLDIAIYVAHVEFPQISNNNYINVEWSEKAKDSSNKLNNPLGFARSFIYHNYVDPVFTNAHAFISGYRFATGAAGIAYLSSMCDKADKKNAYHVTVNIQYGMMARLLSHELGHTFGSSHDVSQAADCPAGSYIMSHRLVFPKTSTSNTYYKFSRCSAESIRNYLNNLNPNQYDSPCLYNTGISDEAYLDQFCQGYRGTGMTYEEICKSAYGPDSFVCSSIGLDNGYVTSCLSSFACSKGNYCYRMNDVPPGTKCTTNGTLGDMICYKGQCTSGLEICSKYTTTIDPKTAEPTTPEPTTPEPTTPEPTTTEPTTTEPTTTEPTTAEPTTTEPTTTEPTTTEPTTTEPTTTEPTTTTAEPQTSKPTTTKSPTSNPATNSCFCSPGCYTNLSGQCERLF